MSIVYRSVKGVDLTPAEVDGNFSTLDSRTRRGWNDLVHEVIIRTGANAPSLESFRDGIVAFAFSPTTSQECFTNFHLRHDYMNGTMIYPHVHWSHNTTSTGTVRWGVEWTWARRGDSGNTGVTKFGPTQTTYIEYTVGANEQYQHQVNEATDGAGIYHADFEPDSLIMCRFFRDSEHVNDTFPDNAFLLTVDLHYECDTFATPSRTPPFA